MFKSELNEDQLKIKDFIVEKLTKAGWNDFNLQEWNNQLESGFSVYPEPEPRFKNEKSIIVLTYPPKNNYISLLISTKDYNNVVEFRFYYFNKIQLSNALGLIINYQNELSIENFNNLIKDLFDICEELFWELQGFEREKITKYNLDSKNRVRIISNQKKPKI